MACVTSPPRSEGERIRRALVRSRCSSIDITAQGFPCLVNNRRRSWAKDPTIQNYGHTGGALGPAKRRRSVRRATFAHTSNSASRSSGSVWLWLAGLDPHKRAHCGGTSRDGSRDEATFRGSGLWLRCPSISSTHENRLPRCSRLRLGSLNQEGVPCSGPRGVRHYPGPARRSHGSAQPLPTSASTGVPARTRGVGLTLG